MNSKIPEFREKLQKKLNPGRYEHSLSVAFTCICLAMRYGYPIDQAEVAGMLHDCAKGYDNDTIIRHCEKKGIEITEDERKAPAVLHAKYGAWLADFGCHCLPYYWKTSDGAVRQDPLCGRLY